MVFHVARSLDVLGMGRAAAELVEDGAIGLAHDADEHVEPAAMRHANDDIAHAELTAALDDLLQSGDERLAAVQPEALGAGIFDVDEALEVLGLDQLVEDGLLALRRKLHLIVGTLDAILNPVPLLRDRKYACTRRQYAGRKCA